MQSSQLFRRQAGVFISFWALFLLLASLQSPIHEMIRSVLDLRSEYRVYEQLSKYYLFLIVLLAIAAYTRAREISRLRASLGFLLLSTILYLAESNMITENVQLLFGPLVLGATLLFLARERAWLVILLLGIGFGVMFGGIVVDFAHEHEAVAALIPPVVTPLLTPEELLDVIGQGFVCLAAIFYFFGDVLATFRDDALATLVLLLSAGLITVGNSFSHWQYQPGTKLEALALFLSLVGFVGVVLANRRFRSHDVALALPRENGFYLFVWIIFVTLPTMFGGIDDFASVVLWSPMFAGFVWYLYTRHPLHATPDRATVAVG